MALLRGATPLLPGKGLLSALTALRRCADVAGLVDYISLSPQMLPTRALALRATLRRPFLGQMLADSEPSALLACSSHTAQGQTPRSRSRRRIR
jgi:hypothetical protein